MKKGSYYKLSIAEGDKIAKTRLAIIYKKGLIQRDTVTGKIIKEIPKDIDTAYKHFKEILDYRYPN